MKQPLHLVVCIVLLPTSSVHPIIILNAVFYNLFFNNSPPNEGSLSYSQWQIYIVQFWMHAPPGVQIVSIVGKIWQNRMLAPPLGSWHPLLGEILDPPLIAIPSISGKYKSMVTIGNQPPLHSQASTQESSQESKFKAAAAARCGYTLKEGTFPNMSLFTRTVQPVHYHQYLCMIRK